MPETYGGHECKVFFVVESSYGQTPTNPSMYAINSENVEPAVNPSLIKVWGIGSRDPIALKRSLRKPTLKLTHILPSDSPLHFIQHATTLNSLSVQVLWYKGVFASATNIISLIYTGMRVDKLTLAGSVDDVVKATVELIGQNVTVTTSKITGATYNEYSGAIYNIGLTKGIGNGSGQVVLERVTDWKFTIDNNLKPVPVVRSSNAYLLKYLTAQRRELTGELTFEFEDRNEFEEVINDSEFSLAFTFGSNTVLFTYCRWEDVAAPTRIDDLVSCKAKFTATNVGIT